MKLENTIEDKQKFMGLYWGQDIWCRNTSIGEIRVTKVDPQITFGWLSLTSLSQISDEDAIEVASIFGWNSYSYESKIHQVKEFLFNKLDYHTTNISANEYFQLLGFLRSRGYYVGDGTEVTFGWAKLKGEDTCKP